MLDEFGHRFYDEWNYFLNYMTGCVQLYLSIGLIECNHINLEKKKMINSTSEGFAEFFISIEMGNEFLKKDLFESFKRDYEDNVEMQLPRFTKWLKEGARIKGIVLIERKSGNDRFVRFGDNGKVDAMDATFLNS